MCYNDKLIINALICVKNRLIFLLEVVDSVLGIIYFLFCHEIVGPWDYMAILNWSGFLHIKHTFKSNRYTGDAKLDIFRWLWSVEISLIFHQLKAHHHCSASWIWLHWYHGATGESLINMENNSSPVAQV